MHRFSTRRKPELSRPLLPERSAFLRGSGPLPVGHSSQLPIMRAPENALRRERPDERHQHVPLGVPNISLGAEEGVGRGASDDGGSPLDELVAGADAETDA